MLEGGYKIKGEYAFPKGNAGNQKGEIEVLQDSRIMGWVDDYDKEHGTSIYILTGMYYSLHNEIYLLKSPLQNSDMRSVVWKLKQKEEDKFSGSWMILLGMKS